VKTYKLILMQISISKGKQTCWEPNRQSLA